MFGSARQENGAADRAALRRRARASARRRRSARRSRRPPAAAPTKGRQDEAGSSAPPARPRRSLIGRLVYWGVVLGGLGRDRRSPGCSPITPASCRRSTSSRCPSGRPTSPSSASTARCSPTAATPAARRCGSSDLPPYLPKAFVAIEDRRFYYHFGVDPVGIVARARARRRRRRRRAGRLDADPAARQEPVPDPGAHAVAQDPGGDPGAVAGAQIFQGPDPRALPQPRLFRLRRLWRRGGGAEVFRQERADRERCRRRRCWRG